MTKMNWSRQHQRTRYNKAAPSLEQEAQRAFQRVGASRQPSRPAARTTDTWITLGATCPLNKTGKRQVWHNGKLLDQ